MSQGDRAALQRARRREQILTAAKEVFAERGYHAASINDIIGRASIARGTFYLYFESKHKVFDSILDEALQELRGRITRVDTGAGAAPPQDQLRGCLRRVLEYVLGDPHFSRLLLNTGLFLDAEVAERVSAFYGDVHHIIAGSLEIGIEMGLVRQCDTSLVSSALLGAVRGIVEHALNQPHPPVLDTIVDELIGFAMSGVVAGELWG